MAVPTSLPAPGTYSFAPAASDIVLHAFSMCQIRGTELTQQHLVDASMAANLEMVNISNHAPQRFAVLVQRPAAREPLVARQPLGRIDEIEIGLRRRPEKDTGIAATTLCRHASDPGLAKHIGDLAQRRCKRGVLSLKMHGEFLKATRGRRRLTELLKITHDDIHEPSGLGIDGGGLGEFLVEANQQVIQGFGRHGTPRVQDR